MIELGAEAALHTFEPSRVGLNDCVHDGCGRPRNDRVHRDGHIRTRLWVTVDHPDDVSAQEAEQTVLEAIAGAAVVTLTGIGAMR